MATAIATVGGIALAPGVSKNRRLYTADAIARAVTRAQARIASGGLVLTDGDDPAATHVMTQMTHHAAEDDSTRVVGRVTGMTLDESGRARFAADIAPTTAGRDIAALLDTSDGKPPFLRGVSIRAQWLGTTRLVKGPDGDPVETGDDLEIVGLDYTHKPGLPAAAVDTFAWTKDGQRSETTEPVLIYESVQEARVAITEDTTPVAEASALPEQPHILEDGFCVTCAPVTEAATPMSKRTSGTQGTGGPFADPGYQADKKQRYQLDTKAHTRAAWSFINQAKNAKAYSAAQLKRIKGRIKSALKKFGVSVSESAGWTVDAPVALISEHYGDPDACGSYSINASNGPTNICISGYGIDPAELQAILQAACDGATLALAALDPDMDGDIDVPGAPNADDDDDAGDLPAVPSMTLTGQESDPADPADPAESETDPAPYPAAGETTETEAPMPESTTPAAETAPAAAGSSQADIDAAVARALEADRAARRARKAARRAAAETTPTAPVTETAPAGGQVQETEDQRIQRLVAAKIAESMPQETDDERIARLVQEGFDAEMARRIQAGQIDPSRKGLVVKETASDELDPVHGTPKSWGKPLHEMGNEEFLTRTGPVLVRHILGDRADKLS